MKFAIYFNHYETLGHSTRVAILVKAIRENFGDNADFLIFRSGRKQRFFNLENYGTVIDLPFSLDKRWFNLKRRFRLDLSSVNKFGLKNMLRRRLAIIKEALLRFKPDVFITEYYPFGREFWAFELEFILRWVRDKFPCKIFSDVGYPFFENDTLKVLDLYDGFFFHCPKEEFLHYIGYFKKIGLEKTVDNLHTFLINYAKKTYFTGYLLDSIKLKDPLKIKNRLHFKEENKMVIASRGGGVVNNDLIENSIECARRLRKVNFLISTGPATYSKDYRHFIKISSGIDNIKIVRFVHDFESYLNASCLSINMAGYNTMVRLLWLNKPAIVVPLDSNEQEWRADFMRRFGNFRILRKRAFSCKSLYENVATMLKSGPRPKKTDKELFEGREKTIAILKCLI